MRFIYTRQFTIFFFLLLTIAGLLLFHVLGWLNPVESALAEVPRPFVYVLKNTGNSAKSFFGYFSAVKNVNRKNAQLSEQILNLEQDNVVLQQYRIENEALKKELGYKKQSSLNLIPASVISKDPTGFSEEIVIDAGSQSGIKPGQAVLAQGVLVGKVSSVDTFTSKVSLIIDPQSTIDAEISKTGDKGIIRGSYGTGLILDLISQNVRLNKGDQVVSAGLSGNVPRGILIGTIGDIQSGANDLVQKVTVISSVDISNLRFISVIK